MPPEATLQDVLRDLVEAPALPHAFNASFPSNAGGKTLVTVPAELTSEQPSSQIWLTSAKFTAVAFPVCTFSQEGSANLQGQLALAYHMT